METITIQDWTFTIDIRRTEEYYANLSTIVDEDLLKETYWGGLVEFLSSLGIDWRKPQGENLDFEKLYYAYGTAELESGYELDFWEFEADLAQDSGRTTSVAVFNNESDLQSLPPLGLAVY